MRVERLESGVERLRLVGDEREENKVNRLFVDSVCPSHILCSPRAAILDHPRDGRPLGETP